MASSCAAGRCHTSCCAAVVLHVAAPSTGVFASTPAAGPASVEGYYDGALAVPGILEAIRRAEAEGPVAAHIIACFDDPGLDAARSMAHAPVVGMCEAAILVARSLAW